MVHILVVDDEPLIAMMLQDWLNEIGFKTVGPACNIADALRLVGSEIVDAAILDVSVGKLRQCACGAGSKREARAIYLLDWPRE